MMINLFKQGVNVMIKHKKNPEDANQDSQKDGKNHNQAESKPENQKYEPLKQNKEEVQKQDEESHHIWNLFNQETWQERIQKFWPLRRIAKRIKGGLGVLSEKAKQRWGNNLQGQQWVQQQKKRNSFDIISPQDQGDKGKKLSLTILANNQIVFIEPSPAQKKIQELKKSGKVFVDQLFPPNDKSLNGQYKIGEMEMPTWSKIKWMKAGEVIKSPKIITGKIEPTDIVQGYLGDCYFLAGLAALAQRPDRIFNLFLTQQLNEQRYCSVKMLYKGKWVTVDMDQYIPWLYGEPAFTKSRQGQLWVAILEKAWAKLYTSYKRIQAGYPEEPLHDLTGAPCRLIQLKSPYFNKEQEWQYLIEASKKQYAMVASSNPGSDVNKSLSGVVQGHAYTVLNATTIKYQGKEERLVQLRNPWGSDQFTGKWSDFDKSWNLVSTQQKQRIGFNPTKQDGIFFMTYDQFIIEFRAVTVAEIDDEASYVYKSYKDKECKGVFFAIDIVREGDYSFQVDKTPERIYPDQYQRYFNYPETLIQIGKIQGNTCKKSQALRSLTRTTVKKERLAPGRYVVFVRIAYNPDFENQFDVNLSVYSKTACNIQLASKQQAVIFTNLKTVQWTGQQSVSSTPWNTMGNIDSNGNNNFVRGKDWLSKRGLGDEEFWKQEE